MKFKWRIELEGNEVSSEDWKKVKRFLKANNIKYHEREYVA